MPRVAGREIDWNELDLTRDAKELAAELGCHTSIIYRMRKKAGIVVPKKSGGPREGAGGPRPGFGGVTKTSGQGRPKKAPAEKLANVALQLLPAVVQEIDSLAEKKGLTRAKVMREAIAQYLERER